MLNHYEEGNDENYKQIKNPVLKRFADDFFINEKTTGYHSTRLKDWYHHDFMENIRQNMKTDFFHFHITIMITDFCMIFIVTLKQ